MTRKQTDAQRAEHARITAAVYRRCDAVHATRPRRGYDRDMPDEKRRAVLADLALGKTARQIAFTHGLHEETVRAFRRTKRT